MKSRWNGARVRYGFYVTGYVVMPEHVHLLVANRNTARWPAQCRLSSNRSRAMIGDNEHFWQARYYDFNVWTARKRIEKLRYIRRNPVKRGLVANPEDWLWSSFRNYVTGEEGVVEVESPWTGRKRERVGTVPRVRIMKPSKAPP